MFKSLQQIKESFIQGGGRVHRDAVMVIGINLLLSGLICAAVLFRGQYHANNDTFSLVMDYAKVILVLAVYCFIAFIPLKPQIKRWIIIGVFLTQLSMLVNLLDAHYYFSLITLSRIEDSSYIIGSILVLFGASRWVTYTYRISTLDKLTRVHNRRFFESMLLQYLHRLQRIPEQSCMLSLDMDDFKLINDQYGHVTGDEVLRTIGNILTECARKSDIICRSGGEEFEILLIGATVSQTQDIAQRILTELVQQTPTPLPTLSASIGVTDIRHDDTIDSLRTRVDSAMYQAKELGKGQIILV